MGLQDNKKNNNEYSKSNNDYFRRIKLTLKAQISLIKSTWHYFNPYNIAFSQKTIHFIDKINLILYPQFRNSITHLTTVYVGKYILCKCFANSKSNALTHIKCSQGINNSFVTSKKRNQNSPIHEFKVLLIKHVLNRNVLIV